MGSGVWLVRGVTVGRGVRVGGSGVALGSGGKVAVASRPAFVAATFSVIGRGAEFDRQALKTNTSSSKIGVNFRGMAELYPHRAEILQEKGF